MVVEYKRVGDLLRYKSGLWIFYKILIFFFFSDNFVQTHMNKWRAYRFFRERKTNLTTNYWPIWPWRRGCFGREMKTRLLLFRRLNEDTTATISVWKETPIWPRRGRPFRWRTKAIPTVIRWRIVTQIYMANLHEVWSHFVTNFTLILPFYMAKIDHSTVYLWIEIYSNFAPCNCNFQHQIETFAIDSGRNKCPDISIGRS